MGKKGPNRHLKRHNSPFFWPIHRKNKKWTIKTSPGPHSLRTSMPSIIILRDVLQYAKTGREAKRLIKEDKFIVDRKIRKNEKFPIGIMDVVSIPNADKHYRVLPGQRGKLLLHPITGDEIQFKLLKIIGKTSLNYDQTQLHFHDGKNIIISPESDRYKLNDVLKIEIPNLKILDHIPFKEGVQVLVTGGRSQGEKGILINLGQELGWKKTANIKTFTEEDVRTLAKYVFPIGDQEPMISLPD